MSDKEHKKLKLIRTVKKDITLPKRHQVLSPFIKREVDWQPLKLSLKDKTKLALIWFKTKMHNISIWRHEHIFLLSGSVIVSFVIAYFIWVVFMHCVVQKTFKEEPDEDYGANFNIWDVYR